MQKNYGEDQTPKNQQYHNSIKEASKDELNYWNDLSHEIWDLRNVLKGWQISGGQGFDYILLQDLLSKMNISNVEAYDICQVYFLRDFRGNWADDVIKHGLLVRHEYEGEIINWGLKRWYFHEVLTPHGHHFFSKFFALAKIWQYKLNVSS